MAVGLSDPEELDWPKTGSLKSCPKVDQKAHTPLRGFSIRSTRRKEIRLARTERGEERCVGVRVVPGCGHTPQLEDPPAVAMHLAKFANDLR